MEGKCFNPRSREGATGGSEGAPCAGDVSTHAPVRERLTMTTDGQVVLPVSTHAPVRERQNIELRELREDVFQPTLP